MWLGLDISLKSPSEFQVSIFTIELSLWLVFLWTLFQSFCYISFFFRNSYENVAFIKRATQPLYLLNLGLLTPRITPRAADKFILGIGKKGLIPWL